MSQRERNILVYANWLNDAQPALMGNLSAIQIRGKEVFAFEYNKDWLKSNYIQLDLDWQFFTGQQFLNDSKVNFDTFMDSSPDWIFR